MLSSQLFALLPRDGKLRADIPRAGLVVSAFLSLSTISVLAVAFGEYELPFCDMDWALKERCSQKNRGNEKLDEGPVGQMVYVCFFVIEHGREELTGK